MRLSILLFLSLSLTACKPLPRNEVQYEPPPVTLPATVRTVTTAEAAQLLSAPGMRIIDARRHPEWVEYGHIPGASLHDWQSGEGVLTEVAKLDKAQPTLVYCAIGARSKLLAVKMSEMGFQRLHWLQGGMNGWVAEGRAIEK